MLARPLRVRLVGDGRHEIDGSGADLGVAVTKDKNGLKP
jgi:hypothetical protein